MASNYADLTEEDRKAVLEAYDQMRKTNPVATPEQIAQVIAANCLGMSSKAFHRKAGANGFAAVLAFLVFSERLKVAHVDQKEG